MTASGKITCPKTNEPCLGTCAREKAEENRKANPFGLTKTIGGEWMEPATLNDLLAALATVSNDYALVCGDTAKGRENIRTQEW